MSRYDSSAVRPAARDIEREVRDVVDRFDTLEHDLARPEVKRALSDHGIDITIHTAAMVGGIATITNGVRAMVVAPETFGLGAVVGVAEIVGGIAAFFSGVRGAESDLDEVWNDLDRPTRDAIGGDFAALRASIDRLRANV